MNRQKEIKMKKYGFKLFLFCLILFLLFLNTGCSRTITQMPSYGNELNVEITLAGNADVSNNKYFIIFSTLEAYKIPLPPPDSLDEFLEPGDEPQPGSTSKEAYYSKYYSTWSSYIIIDSFGYTLVKGPFNINTIPTRETIKTIGDPSSTLTFNINLDKIFGINTTQNVYIDIVSVPYPTDSAKYLKDRISPPVNYFEPIKYTIISRTDSADPTIDPSLDILSWKVNLP